MTDTNGVTFGQLDSDGTLSHVRVIPHSAIGSCPFYILVPEHYRADGTCKCDDAEHRAMMIAEWEYDEESFADIPLRDDPTT